MTAIDFPNSPSVNQTFTVGERTWRWTGSTWDAVVTTEIIGPQGPVGETGPVGEGVAPGGQANQILIKESNNDYDTSWTDLPKISYVHNQSATSSQWTIVHNLGFNPNVTTKDSAGNVIEGDISYNSTSSLTINFSVGTSGYAYLS
jgi:hypothetical protein